MNKILSQLSNILTNIVVNTFTKNFTSKEDWLKYLETLQDYEVVQIIEEEKLYWLNINLQGRHVCRERIAEYMAKNGRSYKNYF